MPRLTPRTDRKAFAAGAALSILAHGILFALVSFAPPELPAPDDRPPEFAPDDGALRLIVVESALESRTRPRVSTDAAASAAADDGAAAARSAGAPATAPTLGGATPAAPPVLLAYRAPVASPLLLASATAEVATPASIASARAAAYTPGGVRKAKLGWSGEDEAKARRDGRIRASLGIGDGHCPARPPRGGPIGF
ncbi:MAG TPA: hypothetical protein VK837_05800 [Longimicrobiales bacterium]|nr:hypothetical protein [Longimicrobiales bacterium]